MVSYFGFERNKVRTEFAIFFAMKKTENLLIIYLDGSRPRVIPKF